MTGLDQFLGTVHGAHLLSTPQACFDLWPCKALQVAGLYLKALPEIATRFAAVVQKTIRDRLVGDSRPTRGQRRWIYSNSLPDGRRGHNGDIGMVSSPLFKISGQAQPRPPEGSLLSVKKRLHPLPPTPSSKVPKLWVLQGWCRLCVPREIA